MSTFPVPQAASLDMITIDWEGNTLNPHQEMPMTVRELVVEQALSLSPEDRVYLLDQLERSLIPEEMFDSAGQIEGQHLAHELKLRADAYRSGATTACDAFEFMADLRCQRQTESAS